MSIIGTRGDPGFIVCLLLTTSVFAAGTIKSAYFNSDVKITIDGKQLDTELVTVELEGQVNGKNYVSARALAEAMGATVDYDSTTKTIKIVSASPAPTIGEETTTIESTTEKIIQKRFTPASLS